jgi:hypothetical protein
MRKQTLLLLLPKRVLINYYFLKGPLPEIDNAIVLSLSKNSWLPFYLHMKTLRVVLFVLAGAFAYATAASQNILINILTRNSGIVAKGENIFLELSVCNTDANDSVTVYKLMPQLSFPAAISIISDKGHILPEGWTITFNNGSTIKLSNGNDRIAPHDRRTILIALKGKNIGGPSTISCNLLFSNGVAPGTTPGSPTKYDNPADNTSTTTIKVTR